MHCTHSPCVPKRDLRRFLRKHRHFLERFHHDPDSSIHTAGTAQLRALQEVLQNVKIGAVPVPTDLIKGPLEALLEKLSRQHAALGHVPNDSALFCAETRPQSTVLWQPSYKPFYLTSWTPSRHHEQRYGHVRRAIHFRIVRVDQQNVSNPQPTSFQPRDHGSAIA